MQKYPICPPAYAFIYLYLAPLWIALPCGSAVINLFLNRRYRWVICLIFCFWIATFSPFLLLRVFSLICFFHMPGKCRLCMKNILGSYFPFSLVRWVMWWIVCAFSQCYHSPIPGLNKKVERVWLEVVSFICHPGLSISTLWGFTGWREVMHKHNAAQQTHTDALFLSHTHKHTEKEETRGGLTKVWPFQTPVMVVWWKRG